ncbi:ParA family protein [Salarchaeum sp. JOR-1]|uniref:ParA family protein n=1 Tax=Salarchaeum sp. JOR-1 TaxID=2599399 RepID=UPI00119890EF|nr:ParA family protein [Salarchaeum sp. JOR-1]QDX39534.1 ParA family protein [Salarchaeum sp. JOR-1]
MAYRLTVANEKGGVGKTTTAINVAGALADRGHEVLFVDLDAQGNGTIGLDLDTAYTDDELSLYDILIDLDEQQKIDAVIRSDEEFDVLPSHVDMFNAESELQTAMRGRERLWMALDELDAEYAYVIVDAPPSLGLLTDNALLACRNVLIPALPEEASQHALNILLSHIDTLEDGYGVDINIVGLVANRIEVDGETDRMLEWFADQYGSLPIWKIRNRVVLKRAWANGTSVFAHSETTDMKERFHTIAAHLEQG